MILHFPSRSLKRIVTYFSFLLLVIFIISCDDKKPATSKPVTSSKIVIKQSFKDKMAYKESDEYKLLENSCLYCHKIGASEVKEVAPQMQIIRDAYKKSFPTKEAFVSAFVKFTMDPSKKNSIMSSSVEQCGLTEDSDFANEDAEEIAAYLYDFKF